MSFCFLKKSTFISYISSSVSSFNQQQENTSKLWGEEKEADGIWGVYLKKVRYQRPSSIVSIVTSDKNSPSSAAPDETDSSRQHSNGNALDEDDDDGIAHLMWETVRIKVLKAGTLRKIVEGISNEDHDVQATHLSVFLATYRAFATPAQVLREIISVYRNSTVESMRKTMIDTLNAWLDSYSEDFEPGAEGYECLHKIVLPFAQEDGLTPLALKVQYKLRSRRKMKKSTSLHSLRTYSPVNIKTYSLLAIPEAHFAQQLTYFDKELFLNLRVWECLGSLWKRRCGCKSVVATVEQFNSLTGRVVATILLDSNATIQQRAKILDKWIRISQELRQLKNFSSLKAIISGLESNPIFRLSKIWQHLSKERLGIYSQLSQIFSEENNRSAQRSLLEAEGTAKFPIVNQSSNPNSPINYNNYHHHHGKSPGEKRSFLQLSRKVLHGSKNGLNSSYHDNEPTYAQLPGSNGTIPYLGTFLTDLTFIDSAIPDHVGEGEGKLINFEKRKKEFEILAQLKLLQGSAKGYRIEEDPYFTTWFNSIVVLDDKSAYEMSLGIQPERTPLKGHRKNDSFASNSSSETNNNNNNINLIDSQGGNFNRKGSLQSSNESSILYGETGNSPSGGSAVFPHTNNSTTESSVIVKVCSPALLGDAVMYKSMFVSNSDHTPQVITQALEKLGLEDEEPKRFYLVQILPNKELKFPKNANVFYALDTSGPPGSVKLELRPMCGVPNSSKVTSNLNNSVQSS